eukprot:GHVR01137405.1.p3 GENE.GHVR01137405.1~~GHVR01137405.1.p3  ORF type:complete len:101 (-),score=17.85 GHVR01137405.1:366-668(-)
MDSHTDTWTHTQTQHTLAHSHTHTKRTTTKEAEHQCVRRWRPSFFSLLRQMSLEWQAGHKNAKYRLRVCKSLYSMTCSQELRETTADIPRGHSAELSISG